MSNENKWRVGIDTGGTFTDIVSTDGKKIKIGKVPSTPPDFETGVLNSIKDVICGHIIIKKLFRKPQYA